jgi:PBP1b-binding outer membrane lipoprotein LpoB
MKKIPVKWFGYLFYFAFLIISCAGTEVTQKQVDDAYKEKPVSDILVIAITGNEHNRRSFEKKFVAHLKSVGVEAVASEESIPMPPDLDLKKETILNAVNQYKNDAVIITQLIGKEARDVYNRGGVTRMGYFSYSRNPGYSSTSTTVRLETNLYDAKTGKLIWSGVSKTLSKDSTDRIMNDVIKAVITQLKQNKLIVPK